MRLVIAEKPSVARDLARVLGATRRGDGYLEGDGLRITWCVGHLIELQAPEHYNDAWRSWRLETLPMVPERFELRPRNEAQDQWRVVREQLRAKDVTDVVNACDAGREGELIFRFVYELADCRRPVLRFWASSLTDSAIRDAWAALRPGALLDNLGEAARCRAQADWLVGLNATRAMTCLARQAAGSSEVLSIGRVQTPTLAMIVGRDLAIEAFVPEAFWQVHAQLQAGKSSWKGTWFGADEAPTEGRAPEDEVPVVERLPNAELAEAVARASRGQVGRVATSGSRRKIEPPPLLYDLTSLQRRANQRYGFSADHTLKLAQDLYERHKLLTYPRTDARYLTPDQVPELPAVLRAVASVPVYRPFADELLAAPLRAGRRVVNAEEVGDHHAILPTSREPSPGQLSPDEKRLYDLVARRFMAVLSLPAEFELTEIIVAIDPSEPLPDELQAPLRFRARGRVCITAGWRLVDPPASNARDSQLPDVQAGGEALAHEVNVQAGQTRPPRPHNDATVLRAMETAGRELTDRELARAMRSGGLGTPATRAAILQTLLTRKFVERSGRDLRATDRGRALIQAIPLAELKSPELTGTWEARLSAVADGRESGPTFMNAVVEHLHTVVDAIRQAEPPAAALVASDVEAGPEVGRCPICGEAVREGRAAWSCAKGRACTFVIFKKVARRAVSARMVKALLTTGHTDVVKGFKSKAGKDFSAALKLDAEGKVSFDFSEAPARAEAQPARPKAPRTPPPDDDRCPKCGVGRVIRGRSSWGCDRFKECDYRRPFTD